MNEWLPECLPVLITNFFFLCSKQIRLKNIWYHVCFDSTDSLPAAADDGDNDDDTCGISTCDMEATHDAVAKICRKQVIWQCYHVSSISWNLIVYMFISWCCGLKFFNNCLCMLMLSKVISFVRKFNIIMYIK